jgi:hypothetical protein
MGMALMLVGVKALALIFASTRQARVGHRRMKGGVSTGEIAMERVGAGIDGVVTLLEGRGDVGILCKGIEERWVPVFIRKSNRRV